LGAYLYERGKAHMALPAAGIYTRYRHLVHELLKFGVVGGIGSVIDLGGAAVLHGKYHVGPLESKAISTTIATIFTYLGSRFWTFKHRENQALGREATLFVALNLVGLSIAEVVIALVTYGFGRHSQLEYNAASVVGTGLATIFRYLAYRRWEGDPAYLAAEIMAPAAASAGWNSSNAAPAPSWHSGPAPSWEPTAEQHSWDVPTEPHFWEATSGVHSWGPSAERTQPRLESSVISNGPVASPLPPTSAATGLDLVRNADPAAASGSRGQGRHRRS
jgi:putative flippase GtrA